MQAPPTGLVDSAWTGDDSGSVSQVALDRQGNVRRSDAGCFEIENVLGSSPLVTVPEQRG
jgi:hypothetical protein